MAGQLFTYYFLTEGIQATSDWRASIAQPEAFARFSSDILHPYETLSGFQDPNEAVTEQELIRPVLELLGWTDYLPQQGIARNEDIPDLLLFSDTQSKGQAAARAKPDERYLDASVIEESKRLDIPLDIRDQSDTAKAGTPHGQILRYLSTADSVADGRIRWGILTNGRVWRLYDQLSRPRASGYFEADLAQLLRPGNEHDLKVFYLLFRRDSFTLKDGSTTTFLEQALAEGKRYEEQVAQDLSGVVFEKAFPRLVEALANATGATLPQVRQAALIFLYRLLFLLYAEDRDLLPVNDSRYDDYGLRKRVRDDVARRMADGDTFSASATHYYDRLMTLFRLVDQGDPSIGLPPYNGGLFGSTAAPLLQQVRLADATIAPILYDLSHAREHDGSGRRFVNYRDMSVQQLGSIYERLLEREPVRDGDGKILIRPNPYARKDSGSFFTPQELVDLIVDQTLKPLAEERLKAFENKAAELKSDRRPSAQRKAELLKLDPAEAVLNLKVLDPAMGSGHFLVTAVDFLSDTIADLIEYVPVVPEWLDGDYVSPLVNRVAIIRREILQRAKESNWVLDEAHLTDQAIIRRMVLKRCIYGVDKNRLTVELAKVSLWLHSFTVGAPLSFLDHHLRCGDSLIGLRVFEASDYLRETAGLFLSSAIAGAEAAAKGMQHIEELSDADIGEVRESTKLFEGVDEMTAELRRLLDFLCSFRWLTAGMKKKERMAFETTQLIEPIGRVPDQAYKLLANGPKAVNVATPGEGEAHLPGFEALWDRASSIAGRENFLHWEAAFPGVWRHWQNIHPEGGFDAVIGNPPWDHIEQPEVEWFALRDNEIAHAATGALRKALIKERQDAGDQLALQYKKVRRNARELRMLVRASGQYPLLSGGRVNLYSLFVERAMGLINPDGIVGLLTPSGIYADKTASRFFQSVSTKGRLGSLFDFENKKIFFKDIHASFKFCALIFGGENRRFDQTECAFFLHDTATVDDPNRCFPLAPEDFARVNPNTGTAPVFRTRRDADLTRRVYERHPVLLDRSHGEERRVWPVRFMQGLFNMTSDSHLFRTAAQLEAEGFYPVQGNRWKRGEELYLPLYQGRIVHQFDHRANSVRYNPENTHNPYLSLEVSEAQHADPAFLPRTQYWVPVSDVEPGVPRFQGWSLAFRDIARPTDVRTMIAAVIPQVGCGHTLPILLPADERFNGRSAVCLLANLNSFVFDFVTRQKVQATHLTWYTIEQLPVIAADDYDRRFGPTTTGDLVRDHVLRLTYTAHDMAPFARDLGNHGPPFAWDEEERRHLRARLDALYFHLYGLSREDARYVLDTFPIVRKQDEAAFGRYRTRDLILAYMNALAAGDTETMVAV